MGAIKSGAYLEGLSLEQARGHAQRISSIDQRVMFVNVRAHRLPGMDEYIISFAVSTDAGETVEAVFINGRERT